MTPAPLPSRSWISATSSGDSPSWLAPNSFGRRVSLHQRMEKPSRGNPPSRALDPAGFPAGDLRVWVNRGLRPLHGGRHYPRPPGVVNRLPARIFQAGDRRENSQSELHYRDFLRSMPRMSFFPCESVDRDRYRQCALEHGRFSMVSWIPKKFAVAGKVLRLRRNGAWEDGWRVTHVGAERIGAPHVPGLVRRHKRATGDSERKR